MDKTLELIIVLKSRNAGSSPDRATKFEMRESKYLKSLLREIGHSVHNLNTIAVSLSNLQESPEVPPAMNIRWESTNIGLSSHNARRFAVRSSIVFAVEILFEYLRQISIDPLSNALSSDFDFRKELSSRDSKARRFSTLCYRVPGVVREWVILVELLCHWRNRIVHASSSSATISAGDRKYLQSVSKSFYNSFHHFDIEKTVSDYEADNVTLKEATTLITLLIKCCRKMDTYFLNQLDDVDVELFRNLLEQDERFTRIVKQAASAKRNRQLAKIIELKCGYLNGVKKQSIISGYLRKK